MIRIRRSTSHHAAQATLHATPGHPGTPSTIQRHDKIRIPRPITCHCDEDNNAPSPIHHIPHPFRQALGLQVIAGADQLASSVGWSTDAFEPEFEDEGGGVEEEVEGQGAAGEEEGEEEVEGVYGEGDGVGAVEGCGVAGGEVLFGFLWGSYC